MHGLVAVLAAVVLAAPLAGAAGKVTGETNGLVVRQQWEVFNYWHNATGNVALELRWWNNLSSVDARRASDLSITVYKPGRWDAQCGASAGSCPYFQSESDIYAQSGSGTAVLPYQNGCAPTNNGLETLSMPAMPTGRFHVVVEGDVGLDVPFILRASAGSLTYNGTAFAFVVYVPPC